MLKAKTQTSLPRLAAGIDACPFPFILQHQVLKELKTHTTGSEVVSWICVLTQIKLFTICNKMHTVFWSVWITSGQSAKDIDLPLPASTKPLFISGFSNAFSQHDRTTAQTVLFYKLVAMESSGAFLSILKYFTKYNTFPSCSITEPSYMLLLKARNLLLI